MARTRASPTALIASLSSPGCYPHPVDRVQVLETHVSYVFLAGEFAYKIKKPVHLGFLDFSSLQARRFYCEEEVRLNRRTAPGLYLGVVPIGGSPPTLRGTSAPVEYAVKMKRFSQDALLDRLARECRLVPATVDALAETVARFHGSAPRAEAIGEQDSVDRATGPALDNFADIAALERSEAVHGALGRLREWTLRQRDRLGRRFALRRLDGYVRECHGDLHLGNVVLADGAPVLFDCIEFDARLRWIDVMSDVAFTVMDLEHHGLPRLAARFLDAYLERTGDYAGLRVLRFYLVYRAMVRAKIACIRYHQHGLTSRERAAAHAEFLDRLRLAERLARSAPPVLVLMHGLSGSGKTTASALLVEALGAVRIRSDVERKRLHGMQADAASGSGLAAGLYSREETRRTYAHLATLAHEVLAAGYPVVVDAAFLDRADRDHFRHVARTAGAAFELVTCMAPDEVLRERIARRGAARDDASEAGAAVLDLQRRTGDALADDERIHCVALDTTHGTEWRGAIESLARRFHASRQ
ncbi:MAG: bifunctional aminoglycoside phosphotransferase/ATP-binding protein [Usitatibacter sp.]